MRSDLTLRSYMCLLSSCVVGVRASDSTRSVCVYIYIYRDVYIYICIFISIYIYMCIFISSAQKRCLGLVGEVEYSVPYSTRHIHDFQNRFGYAACQADPGISLSNHSRILL